MRTSPATPALIAIGSFLAACAHSPAGMTSATPPSGPAEWRADGGRLAARLAYVVANVPPGAAGASGLRRAIDWIAGTEPDATAEAWLQRPFGVTALAGGGFAVADPDAGRITRFDAAGAYAGEVRCAGVPWQAPTGLTEPLPGMLLVADAAAGAVIRWTESACRVFAVPLTRPVGIASTAEIAWVADAGSGEIVAVTPDGAEVARWRGDVARNGFGQPSAVAVGPGGDLFVVDGLLARVARLDAKGALLAVIPSAQAAGGLARPKGVHVDGARRVFVTDAQRDLLLVFDPEGGLLLQIGEPGGAAGQFAHPAGIGGGGDRVFVADSLNRRVQAIEIHGATQ